MDRSKLLRPLPHGEFRRPSLAGHLKRRGTLFQLDPRRGSILHRDSRLQHPGHADKVLAETKETGDELSTESRPENDATQNAAQDVATDTAGGAATENPGIPQVRVNTLFQENPAENGSAGATEGRPGHESGAGVVFGEEFISKSRWSTLPHILSALRAMKGGGCPHVLSEVKSIAEPGDPAPVDEQARDQITVLAQHAVDSE